MNSAPSVHHTQDLLFLLSQYELLERTAQHLSTLDLFNIALTCHDLYSAILDSPLVFNKLKRLTICDGRGLIKRQTFTGLHKPHPTIKGQHTRGPIFDEEIEIRVYNVKCDAYNALPCLKCGINICKECRYMPRVRDAPGDHSRRRPHLDPAYESHTIICYCADCDEKVQNTLPVRLSEVCDCDQYTRWICHACRQKEEDEDREYYKKSTVHSWQHGVTRSTVKDGLWLPDHQFMTAFWCPCGKRSPKDGNVRCTWCRRRHDLHMWMEEDPDYIPYFDGPLDQSEIEI